MYTPYSADEDEPETTSRSLKLLLADDHTLFAEALTNMLQTHWPNCSVSHAPNTQVLLNLLRESEHFDAVLLDFGMPGMDSNSSIAEIVQAAAPSPVILVSGLATASEVSHALTSGVMGFVPKHLKSDDLIAALNDALQRNTRQSDPKHLLQTKRSMFDRLSPRERETASFMARGLSNKEIALRMELSPETVKIYSKSILTKFSVRNRTEFAIQFMRYGADRH